MAYVKTNWVNGETPINADNLNNMEDGIASAFRFLGKELIASVEDDTPANWAALGDGIVYYETTGLLNNQPTTYGFVENIVCGNLVFQTFHAMNGKSGKWTRSGNSSGWYSGSANWVKSLDENGGIQIKKLWENASPGSDFAEQSINMDLSYYAMIAIHSRPLKQYTREVCNIFRVDCGIGYLSETYSAASSATVKIHNRCRQVSFSAESITFYKANAYSGAFFEGVIDTLIPVVIYGIKGVA